MCKDHSSVRSEFLYDWLRNRIYPKFMFGGGDESQLPVDDRRIEDASIRSSLWAVRGLWHVSLKLS